MLDEDAVEHALHDDLLLVAIEAGDSLELKPQLSVNDRFDLTPFGSLGFDP